MSVRPAGHGTPATALWIAGIAGRTITLFSGVATLLLLIRVLGSEGRGEYFIFLTALALLTTLADCGTAQGLAAREARLSVTPGEQARALPAVALLALALSAAALGVAAPVYLLLGPWVLPNASGFMIGLVAAALPANLYVSLWTYAMIGQRRILLLNTVLALGAVLSLCIHALFLALSGGLPEAAMGAYAASMVTQALIMGRATRGTGPRSPAPAKPLIGEWREVLAFGIRIYPGSIATLAWSRIPVLLLNAFHGPAEVGYFAVAQQIADKAVLPVSAAQDAIYSAVSTLPAGRAREAMSRYARVGMWGMALLVLPVVIVAEWASLLAFGADFESGVRTAAVLRVLLVGTPFMAGAMLMSGYFLGQLGKPGVLSILAVTNVMGVVILGFACIPLWAEVGAAASLAALQVAGAAVILSLYIRISGAPVEGLVVLRLADVRTLVRTIGRLADPARLSRRTTSRG